MVKRYIVLFCLLPAWFSGAGSNPFHAGRSVPATVPFESRSAPELPEQEPDSVRMIEGVVVTVSRIDRSVIPAQVLAGKDLERLSVYSVADAMRYFSGIQIKDYGGG